MRHELICRWLQLPKGSWPPDPYALLNVEPGQTDPEKIEAHAQERMGWLRPYQIAHPREVTEAMNRLAQALVRLTKSNGGCCTKGSWPPPPATRRSSQCGRDICDVALIHAAFEPPPQMRFA